MLNIKSYFLIHQFKHVFGYSKIPSHCDGSFEYPQHMFWLRDKKITVVFFITHIYLNVTPSSGHWVVISRQGILRMSCSMGKGISMFLKLLPPASIDTVIRRSMMLTITH